MSIDKDFIHSCLNGDASYDDIQWYLIFHNGHGLLVRNCPTLRFKSDLQHHTPSPTRQPARCWR